MFYRPDYNMLMCFANGHASTSDSSHYLHQNNLAGPAERLLRAHQAQTFQDLMNYQQKIFNNHAGFNLINNNLRYTNENLQTPQMSNKELEWLKKLLENAGKPETKPDSRRLFETDVTRPDSPGSDVSSGFGTMPSPVSDLDSPPILTRTPPTPNQVKPQPPKDSAKDTIRYQGRDLLDLYTNMTYQWSFQMAVLPPHTLSTHFQYRSLYHRLGPYGMVDELATETCSHCDFQAVVPKN